MGSHSRYDYSNWSYVDDNDFWKVCYEDEYMAVVWKPSGMTVSTPQGDPTQTLELAIPYALKKNQEGDYTILSTLDKQTSGLVLVGKGGEVGRRLQESREQGRISERFRVICLGNVFSSMGNDCKTLTVTSPLPPPPTEEASVECTSEVKPLFTTRTRNSPDEILTTVDITCRSGHVRHQPRLHMLEVGNGVIGGGKHAVSHKQSRDKGTMQALVEISGPHPVLPGKNFRVVKEEPRKFETMRAREEKFWQKHADSNSGGRGSEEEMGIPLAYQKTEVEFCGHLFHVTPAVMIPRAATEVLVSAARQHLHQLATSKVRILDIGTGSGCVVLSLIGGAGAEAEGGEALALGLDISPDALAVAAINADRLHLSDRVHWHHGSFSETLPPPPLSPSTNIGTYDIIVSNPPYQPIRRQDNLRHSQHEPSLALVAGESGYEAYGSIHQSLTFGSCVVHAGTALFLEVGKGMDQGVVDIFTMSNNGVQQTPPNCTWRESGRWKDQQGFIRCVGFVCEMDSTLDSLGS
ncbi:S-adenosyl-L-methionine-dependent methyltransferase [Phlyctochytrium arcticum]|nr:S-adenosyl-L-methionine-dependent methyltransferase [Phlyctochytrium arcticum]